MSSTQSMYDRHISIFSPNGRLFQVEYVFKAVKSCGLTSITLKNDDVVVSVCQRKVPDKLLDPASITSVFKITPSIGAIILGFPADCKGMASRARDIASEFSYENGYDIPVHFLAEKIANQCQVYTQHAYMRLHATMITLFALDDEAGPQIYRVDPAGNVMGHKAAASGVRETEAINALEKVVKTPLPGNEDALIRLAVSTLQTVTGVDFQPQDVEVAICSREKPRVQVLSNHQVEEHLNYIAELD